MSYDLHIFSTGTMSWSTKTARLGLAPRSGWDYRALVSFHQDKVLNLGGSGWLGWVDHRHGILMCDVAGHDPEMRLVPLPPLTPVNEEDFRPDAFGCAPSLRPVWSDSDTWEWVRCCAVDSAGLSPSGTRLPGLFPEIWDRGANRLTLHNVMSSDPALDLCRDDVFYVAAQLADDDTNGWFLAVNARSNKLEQVVPFFDDRAFFDHNYLLCVLSPITSI
ncbi:hypothetical protein QOZ80_2AG0136360 [Eleusine coracana subsp. coracana]|nr:hypothetical protein QOZ80_2AG0136360 [Eleusine coracana subsp. coracana]